MHDSLISKIVAVVYAAPATFAALDPFARNDDDFSVALKAAISALASAVVFLFFWFRASYKKMEKQLTSTLEARDRDREQSIKTLEQKIEVRDRKIERLAGRVQKLSYWKTVVEKCSTVACALRADALQESNADDPPP